MKRFNVNILLSIILLSMATWSCDKDPSNDDDDNGSGSKGNNLADGQIEMVIYPDTRGNITFYIEAKKIHVDWGDGQVEEFASYGKKVLTHNFSQKQWTIKINTEELTSFRDYAYYQNPTRVDYIIEGLKFGYCPRLYEIRCPSSTLTSIDVSKCTALTALDLDNNELTSIDVSKCTALTSLDVYNNKLTSIDVSKCTALTSLALSHNELTAIDVNKALTSLGISNNKLSTSTLNRLFNDLPVIREGIYARVDVWENPGAKDCDKTIAEKKGWSVDL